MIDEPFGVAVPSVPLRDSGTLTVVVAQVRFPIVASIGEQAFIGAFQERIRALYPDLRREMETQIVVGPDGVHTTQAGTVWRFSEGADRWEVTLAPEFLALSTKRYTNRSDFIGRLAALVEVLGEWLHPQRVRRFGVRYVDRIKHEHVDRISQLLRPEVVGLLGASRPEDVAIHHAVTDCEYRFADDAALRARFGFLEPRTTFDPAIEPDEDESWVLDLDAWHGERDFDPASIRDYAQLFSDRIYRYFRWAVTDEFLATFGEGGP